MNRKLHRFILALSSTAAVFTVLLLAAVPASAPHGDRQGLSAEEGSLIDDASLIAAPAPDAGQRRHLRHSRELLALPYFSFAQGLRRNRS